MHNFQNTVAAQIAAETHGCDVSTLDPGMQAQAVINAAKLGREQFIDTLICLLPEHLRMVASQQVDAGVAGVC